MASTPARARAVPFILFACLTLLQGRLGAASVFWVYLGKTLVGAWLVWSMRSWVAEMRWAMSWEAALAGVWVFALWVGLDPFYPHLGGGTPWDPHEAFGHASVLAWVMAIGRLIGSTVVVPPLEEVFYRSFIYRYVVKQDFLSVPLGQLHWGSLMITSVVFGLAHREWLAGILCGLVYQWLVIRKGRLGDAITAHAITNCLLGLYVIYRQQWGFW